ncbi:MAG TPA: Hsp20/alpha crystallin family protein [Nitrosomonas sp.]|nr:Hsp20/alpha crystallin family protein [Nitrosomonas sp.]
MSEVNQENIPVTTGKKSVISKPSLWPSHPFAEMERVFDRIFGRGQPSLWHRRDTPLLDNVFEFDGQRLPNLDVIDRENEMLVRAELPGIDKKNLNISITDNLLSIKGESGSETKEEKGDFYRHEISSFSFARSINLPCAVDDAKVTASLKNGILEITLPKTETSKRRNIQVQ